MIAVLHDIRSMHNVGSIFRTADAAGIKKIYLTGLTAAPVDRLGNKRQQIAKVALGAEDYIPWEKRKSISPLLRTLRTQGYRILAIEQSPRSMPYYRFDPLSISPLVRGRKSGGKSKISNLKSKICLIVGNEIRGLPKSVLNFADRILEIPMHGRKESLNVSVAFGIVGFYLVSLIKNSSLLPSLSKRGRGSSKTL